MPNRHLCDVTAAAHHFHTDKPGVYVGSTYLAVCCHCGRVQYFIYKGRERTTDLHWMGGSDCGPYYG